MDVKNKEIKLELPDNYKKFKLIIEDYEANVQQNKKRITNFYKELATKYGYNHFTSVSNIIARKNVIIQVLKEIEQVKQSTLRAFVNDWWEANETVKELCYTYNLSEATAILITKQNFSEEEYYERERKFRNNRNLKLKNEKKAQFDFSRDNLNISYGRRSVR